MKWLHETHKRGEERKITKFLWWPKRFGNVTRWLEMAVILQVYDDSWDNQGGFKGWIDKQFYD